jgi:hypothetical protein
MKYLVDVTYTDTQFESVEVDVESIGEITEDFLFDHLSLDPSCKITDFTINAQ